MVVLLCEYTTLYTHIMFRILRGANALILTFTGERNMVEINDDTWNRRIDEITVWYEESEEVPEALVEAKPTILAKMNAGSGDMALRQSIWTSVRTDFKILGVDADNLPLSSQRGKPTILDDAEQAFCEQIRNNEDLESTLGALFDICKDYLTNGKRGDNAAFVVDCMTKEDWVASQLAKYADMPKAQFSARIKGETGYTASLVDGVYTRQFVAPPEMGVDEEE